jgi:hypothetical protein
MKLVVNRKVSNPLTCLENPKFRVQRCLPLFNWTIVHEVVPERFGVE